MTTNWKSDLALGTEAQQRDFRRFLNALLVQGIKFAALWLGFTVLTLWVYADKVGRQHLWDYAHAAHARNDLFFFGTEGTYHFNGKTVRGISHAKAYGWYRSEIYRGRTFSELAHTAGAGALILAVPAMGGFLFLTYRRAARERADVFIRGAKLVSASALARKLRWQRRAGDFALAGVPILKGSETRGIFMTGAVGAGKSTVIRCLGWQIRAKGQKALVHDSSGEYIEEFYRPGHDILLNPLDARCPPWNLWQEVGIRAHYDLFAASLVPPGKVQDEIWIYGPRMLMAALARKLAAEGRASNKELYEIVTGSTLEELYKLVKGTPAAPTMNPKVAKMAESIRATLALRMAAWEYLEDPTPERPGFSIRDWVRDESDRWVFLATTKDTRHLLKPLLTCWFDMAVSAILALRPDEHGRRLWYMLDEVTSLDHLENFPILIDEGRKYGSCPVIGIQTVGKFKAIYGADMAPGIWNNIRTKLILATTDPDTTEWLSRTLGSAEVEEAQETQSMGGDGRTDRTTMGKRRMKRQIVLESELAQLPDLEGYLIVAGNAPAAKVKFPVLSTDGLELQPYFLPKEDSSL